jgi:hypothetical protein
MSSQEAPQVVPEPELNETQKGWVLQLEKDNPMWPVGYASALVQMYVADPDNFVANINALQEEGKAKKEEISAEATHGEGWFKVLDDAEAAAAWEGAEQGKLEIIPDDDTCREGTTLTLSEPQTL